MCAPNGRADTQVRPHEDGRTGYAVGAALCGRPRAPEGRPYRNTHRVGREKVNWPEGPREAGLGRDLGARCSAEGTRQARSLNKETQQMQILHHERQRAGEIPFF